VTGGRLPVRILPNTSTHRPTLDARPAPGANRVASRGSCATWGVSGRSVATAHPRQPAGPSRGAIPHVPGNFARPPALDMASAAYGRANRQGCRKEVLEHVPS
jgi:hypothetical protein